MATIVLVGGPFHGRELHAQELPHELRVPLSVTERELVLDLDLSAPTVEVRIARYNRTRAVDGLGCHVYEAANP